MVTLCVNAYFWPKKDAKSISGTRMSVFATTMESRTSFCREVSHENAKFL